MPMHHTVIASFSFALLVAIAIEHHVGDET